MTVEAILDFAGERRGDFRLIACEVASHDAYGTPRRQGYAPRSARREWTPEIAQAWDTLLADIDACAAAPARRFALHQHWLRRSRG
ncbi:hypothetical protein [Bradyrhizobium sp. CCBAU 25338]|uniref:hypothetical protein n=1 Tax=Bradyrhizobium sp. CCBAU 25338 TaxID=1641877 RepID=UPI002FE418D2